MKTCKRCGESKPLTEFYANPTGRQGTRPECKTCTNSRRKRWYAENREREIERVLAWQRENPEAVAARTEAFRAAGKKKIADRKSHLKRKYGLTIEEYDAMLAAQDGGCASCGKPNPDNVDHDHETGRVRGILCWNCNVGVGQFEDDIERLITATAYLDRDDELAGIARERAVALTA